jgi:hypothetical protein
LSTTSTYLQLSGSLALGVGKLNPLVADEQDPPAEMGCPELSSG